MSQLQNQFAQTVVKGMPDLHFNSNTMSCEVKTGEATPLIPGQAVTMVDSAGGVPKVTAVTVNTELVMGYVSYNQKQASFAAEEPLEISLDGNVLYLEASAAIARGASIMPVVVGSKVATATIGLPISGVAIDKAAADGDLIRVYVKSFGFDLSL